MSSVAELTKTIESALSLAGISIATIEQRPGDTIRPPSQSMESRERDAVAIVIANDPRTSKGRRLELHETIGEGGMGIVRRGTQVPMARSVAVKTVRPEQSTERGVLKLLREAWVTGRLEHPNVVPVYDIAVDDDGTPLVVLKRIEGDDWSKLMRAPDVIHERFGVDDPLEWNLRVLMQVANAVRFAHTRGIIHRDIKPENVMVGEFGEVYLMDWGLAVSIIDDESGQLPLARDATDLAGTPLYMAPEMMGGKESRISERTDVYLLGATLYELVAGHPPHRGGSLMQIVSSIIGPPAPLDASVAPELASIIRKAMAFEAADRFEGAEDLRLALQSFLEHRDATRIARLAAERLATLRGALDAAKRDPDLDLQPIYNLFGECRFGFRHALEVWPESETAQRGLSEATIAMVEHELSRDEPMTAHALLTELSSPPSELAARVETAVRDKEKRDAELRLLGADLDPSVGRRTRAFFAAILGTMWTVIPAMIHFVLQATAMEPTFVAGFAWDLGMIAILVLFGVWGRESLRRTAINRRISRAAVLAVGAQLVIDAGSWLAGETLFDGIRTRFIVWAAIVATLSFSVDRWLAVPALAFLAAFLVHSRAPELGLLTMSVANLVLVVSLVLLWGRRGDVEAGLEHAKVRRDARHALVRRHFSSHRGEVERRHAPDGESEEGSG